MSVLVASTGVIAALGVAVATFTSVLIPLGAPWAFHDFQVLGHPVHWELGLREVLAVGAIVLFSAVNCAGLVLGARVQLVLTIAKLAGIGVIVVAALALSPGVGWDNLRSMTAVTSPSEDAGGLQAFGIAMTAALWAYNGWYCVPMVAGEIREPERNVSRGLILGMTIVISVYLLANLAYFYLLPLAEVVSASSTAHAAAPPVAVKAAAAGLGPTGRTLVSIAFIVSAIGALNGVIMTTARIPFAMARDGLLPEALARISPRKKVPAAAIITQGMWASVLALSGTFDQLTTYVIFASWIFYGTTASSVFVLRRKLAAVHRGYRVLGYPLVPLVFVLVAAWLVLNTLFSFPIEAGTGLALIGLGVPYYLWIRWRRRIGGGT